MMGRTPLSASDPHHIKTLVLLLLGAACLWSFWPVQFFDFVSYDDNLYVTGNRQVRSGLSLKTVIWSFTADHAANWHPLTWLSLMADHDLFGLNAGGYHWTNVLLHTASTLLLFLVLQGMTGAAGRSAFVAALFALHPLHVESVAWIAERKDVLSGFFWILTLGAYGRYVKEPSRRRYGMVLLSFSLGLMSKAMLVTLPLVLLLMDLWPLERWRRDRWWAQPLLDKIPLLVLALLAGLLTLLVQDHAQALSSLHVLPLETRLANAFVAYGAYLARMVWPGDLAVFYPYTQGHPAWQVGLSASFFCLATLVACLYGRRRPYLAVGWFWYVVTLLPVIGLIQAGSQALADRYTYIPLIGPFIILAWGGADLLERLPRGRAIAPAAALVVLVALTWGTRHYVRYWENSITLFERALAVTKDNYLAHNNLGLVLMNRGKPDEAIGHFQEALRIRPRNAHFLNNLGVALTKKGRYDEAIGLFRQTVRLQPDYADGHFNLGDALAMTGRPAEAFRAYQAALRYRPDHPDASINMALFLMERGHIDEAIRLLATALEGNPDSAEAHNNLAICLVSKGRPAEAIGHLQEALRLRPDYGDARSNLQKLVRKGRENPTGQGGSPEK